MKTFNETLELEVEWNNEIYDVDVTVNAHEQDASFDHEFGTRPKTEIEIDEITIDKILVDKASISPLHISYGLKNHIEQIAQDTFIDRWQYGHYN